MIVVDSNVLAYLYLPCEYTKDAEKWLEKEPLWIAPKLWRSEFRNILAGYLRRQLLTLNEACALQHEAEHLLADTEFEVDSLSVLNLVNTSDCSAYDCEFIALALQFETKLVTMDKKLLRAFPKVAVALT